MDLGIKELGITLMVGAFTMLGFEAILYYFFNKQLIGFFEGKLGLEADKQAGDPNAPGTESTKGSRKGKGEKDQTMAVTVFIVFAFAVGIIAEDLSYKYVDSANIPFRTIPAKFLPNYLVQKFDLPSEADDLVSTLIGDLENPYPSPLIRDLAANDAFLISDNSKTGQIVQGWIGNTNRCRPGIARTDVCPSQSDIKASLKGLYYYAKNTVYGHDNHYDELRKIQARLEFTRSLSLIAFLYFIITFVTGTSVFFWHLSKRKGSSTHQRRQRELRNSVPIVLAILFSVYFVSIWAFARETDAFNKRAFGYFSTMLITEGHQAKQKLRETRAAGDQAGTNASPTDTPQPKP